MWKCASNCLLATINKGLFPCGNKILSAKTIPRKCNSLLKLSPVLLERFSRYYGFYKDEGGEFSKGKKRRKNPNQKKTSFLGDFNNNVFDVLTWSGVFVLGYYLAQPFRCKKWRSSYENCNRSTLSGCHDTLNYLIHTFGPKPINYILPEVKAARTRSGRKDSSDNCEGFEESDAFEKAHQKVSGILSNWLGVQYMQSGNHKEALDFFIKAANDENASGIFNLGICHEKGLGTHQDFKKAAEFYQRATDLGHPNAMYNLGVFYARGLGVIEADVDRARELFTAAAQLGQKDAEKALSSELPIRKESVMALRKIYREQEKFEDYVSRLLFKESIRETAESLLENSMLISEEESNSRDSIWRCDDSGALDLSPRIEESDESPF